MNSRKNLPLIYSCSGCSNLAQLANRVAVKLDREGVAEMSCIAGVGGGVHGLVATATSGRPIVAVDGCPLHCVKHVLAQRGVTPVHHVTLTSLGFCKQSHEDATDGQAEVVEELVRGKIGDVTRDLCSAAR